MIWVRSAVYNVWFVGATIVLGLFGIGIRFLAPGRSLWLAQLWSRTLLGGARVICGIRTEVIGRENLPPGPALIASQHQSAFDTLVWLILVPNVSYVYKAELSRIPLVGPLLASSGQIMIDRGASFAAVKSLLKGADRARREGRQIVIFPEGTRLPPGVRGEILPGVAALSTRTALPIIPVATDSGRLWGRQAFLKRPGTVHIVIGPAIPPQPAPALLAALRDGWNAGDTILAACG